MGPDVESYLEAVCVKWHVQNLCKVLELIENPCLKLENVITIFYITLSKVNIVFSNCLQINETQICTRYFFVTLDDISVLKVTISASLTEMSFPNWKILEQAALTVYILNAIFLHSSF